MGETIQALERNGHTYRSEGSIYFKISTLPAYGKLAHLDHAGIKSGARIDSDKYEKEDARDFVLWKATKEGEPTWDPGIGPGRPGWHIECSAMALRILGEPPIDIHAGGVDLIFPHHENEIAQSEGATGKEFSRFWVHVEHLMIEDEDKGTEKMSKSLGNVFNLQDIRDRGFRPSALRYLYLGTHYRKQLKFSWTAMAQSEEALKRITDFLARLEKLPARANGAGVAERLDEAARAFAGHIADDLNTAAALGVMFDLVRALNTAIDAGELGAEDAAAVRATFERFDAVLGVLALRAKEDQQPPVPVGEIDALIEARKAARLARNFAEADRIRKDLDARGIVLEDTGSTTRWKRK
jgi:cysteinyl-tRNA synthetase